MSATRDLTIRFLADVKQFGKGTKEASDDLKKVGKAADETKADLNALDKTKVSPDVKLDNARADRQIAALKRRLDVLDREIVDLPIDADPSKAVAAMRRTQRQIDALEREKATVEIDVDADYAEIGRLEAALAGVSDELVNVVPGMGGLSGVMGRLPLKAGGVAASAALAGTGLGLMAADAESARARLTAFFDTADEANAFFQSIQDYAAETPFEFPELLEAGRVLKSFGLDGDEAVATLRDLGEAAAATGQPVSDLALIYGQMLSKGKIQSEDALQFAERGINVFAILAEQLGVTEDEIKAMAESGKLGRKEIEQLGDAIGQTFTGATAAQAETFDGKMSTIKDTLRGIGQDIGAGFLPVMKSVLDVFGYLLKPIGAVADAFAALTSSNIGRFALDLLNPFELLGKALDALSLAFAEIADSPIGDFFSSIGDALATADQWFGDLVGTTDEAADSVDKVGSAAGGAAPAMGSLATATDKAKDSTAGLVSELQAAITAFSILDPGFLTSEEATLRYRQAVDTLRDSVDKKNRVSLDERQALLDYAQAADAKITSDAGLGASSDQIRSSTEKARAEFVKTATQMGYTKTEAEALADKYGLIPENVVTKVETSGVQGSIDLINRLNRYYDSIPTTVNTNVITRHTAYGDFDSEGGRATGGTVTASQAYVVGERGPELFMPSVSGYVQARSVTEALLRSQRSAQQEVYIPAPVVRVYVDGEEIRSRVRRDVVALTDATVRARAEAVA